MNRSWAAKFIPRHYKLLTSVFWLDFKRDSKDLLSSRTQQSSEVCRGHPKTGRGLQWPIFNDGSDCLRTQQVPWFRNFFGADHDGLIFPSLFHCTSRFPESPQFVRQSQVNSYVGWLRVWQVLLYQCNAWTTDSIRDVSIMSIIFLKCWVWGRRAAGKNSMFLIRLRAFPRISLPPKATYQNLESLPLSSPFFGGLKHILKAWLLWTVKQMMTIRDWMVHLNGA